MSGASFRLGAVNVSLQSETEANVSVCSTSLRLTVCPGLIPTLPVPAEHQHSSGIIRQCDGQVFSILPHGTVIDFGYISPCDVMFI